MTIPDRIEELEAEYGGLRALGRAMNIDYSYLSRLKSVEKTHPTEEVLRRLGLRRIVTYERL